MNFLFALSRFLIKVFTAFGLFRVVSDLIFGKRITAVAGLTMKAAFRFRLILALAFILLVTVIGLPLIIKDDGTARGLTQILLTYTLGTIATLLGFATLWLGCGTMARDVEECQMQVVSVKPIPRWQIWLGKWLGILALDAILLGVSGLSVYSLVLWRADHAKLRPDQREILRNEVLVGRISAKEKMPDYEADVERITQERMKDPSIATMDRDFVRKQIRELVKSQYQAVGPSFTRTWRIKLNGSLARLKDQPFSMRIKYHAAQVTSQTRYGGIFVVGPPGKPDVRRMDTTMLVDSFQEYPLPPNAFDENGVLTIEFFNPNPATLLFPLEDGMEVLYRECGFGLNFFRGLLIIYLWLALLAALGLASASSLSFPVASFLSLGVLIVGLSSGLLSNVVKEDSVMAKTHDEGTPRISPIDAVLVPIFKGLLEVVRLVENFSPIDNLSSGRSITWGELGRAFVQITLFMTGLFGLIGVVLFQRRELATAQATQ